MVQPMKAALTPPKEVLFECRGAGPQCSSSCSSNPIGVLGYLNASLGRVGKYHKIRLFSTLILIVLYFFYFLFNDKTYPAKIESKPTD